MQASLSRLGLDEVDLYLMHTPFAFNPGDDRASMEALVDQGLCRVLLAFAPLGHAMEPRLLDDPLILTMARPFGRTPAQVLRGLSAEPVSPTASS
ncbi:MAG: dehydrogenase [Mycobacterium sp.]|nr:dehydrogenase [Mycobacterium sp.]